MQIKNSSHHYGMIAVVFHWVMAIFVIGMLVLGLYMTSLPKGPKTTLLIGWHKEYGILILMLVIGRFIWRNINETPTLLTFPYWQQLSARSMHLLLYALMFVMPITGWLISSSAGHGVSFFGLPLPPLMPANSYAHHLFSTFHTWLAYGLIACIVLHSIAALMHHYVNKDDVLRRIFF